jgi:flagellin
MISEINNSGDVSALQTYQIEFGKLVSGSQTQQTMGNYAAAEIVLSNELRGNLVSVEEGLRNIWDGISLLQVADSSLDTISQNLNRMKELVMQAAGGGLSPAQKQMIQDEIDDLALQNIQFGEMTKYNGVRVHKNNQAISITAAGDKVTAIHTKSIEYFTVDINNIEVSISSINMMIDYVTSYRGALGSQMKALEDAAAELSNKAENILESQSRIADTDMASAVSSMVAASILAEAGSIQAHAQVASQIVSNLL